MSRRVLVTGSSGYIGQVLVPLLQARGWDVVGLDAGYFDGCDLPPYPTFAPTIRKDIRDVAPSDVAGVDGIIHLAGLSNDPLGEIDPNLTYDINLDASVRLAEMAREAGIRKFVFSSSCSVYGVRGDRALTEDDTLEPITAYAISKVRTEERIRPLASRSFCPVYLRNATVFGASPRLRFDLVVNNFVGSAWQTNAIKILSDGTPWRPLIHVADVSAAFIAALEADPERVWNQSINVGSDAANYTVRDIANAVGQAIPEAGITFSDAPVTDSRSYRVDFGKLRRVLPEFTPTHSLEDGISELWGLLRSSGLDPATFGGPRFNRLAHIKELQAVGAMDGRLRLQLLPSAA